MYQCIPLFREGKRLELKENTLCVLVGHLRSEKRRFCGHLERSHDRNQTHVLYDTSRRRVRHFSGVVESNLALDCTEYHHLAKPMSHYDWMISPWDNCIVSYLIMSYHTAGL